MGPHRYSHVGTTRMFGKVGVFFEALAVRMSALSCQTPKPRVNRPLSISQERGEECCPLYAGQGRGQGRVFWPSREYPAVVHAIPTAVDF